MFNKFRNKLLVLFWGVLAIAMTATLAAVLHATSSNVESIAMQELEVSARVFEKLLNENTRYLKDQTQLLANDYAFRQAIATGEKSTLISALGNHGERIEADVMLLLSKDLTPLLSTHDTSQVLKELTQLPLDTSQSINMVRVVENTPYQLVLVPVFAPDLVGWAGAGFAIDLVFLETLKQITKTDISLLFREPISSSTLHISTLEQNQWPTVDASLQVGPASTMTTQKLKDLNWLSYSFALLDQNEQQIFVLLSTSLQQQLQSYEPMRIQITAITGLALLLALLTVVFIAKGITRPIDQLVEAAIRISSGNYTKPIKLNSEQEFTLLGQSLNTMQEAVSEREARIKHLAQHDLLTQLPNRYHISNILNERIQYQPRSIQFGLGLIDIRNFSHLTDLYGSTLSDELLKQITARLQDTLRRGDLLARTGDTQFLLFLDQLDHHGIPPLANKLLQSFKAAFDIQNIQVGVDLNIGFVLSPEHGQLFDELMRRAQIALLDAEKSGNSYLTYFTGQDEHHLRQIKITNRLLYAIENDCFELFFQPKYDLKKCRVTQMEALLRWNDDEMGQMFPDEFIPIAEHSGNITRISEQILKKSLAILQNWESRGISIGISINLSGQDLLDKDFVTHSIDQFKASKLHHSALTIEITESVMMSDMDTALSNIRRYKETGIKLSMDDFGTGYSSLAQLKSLPVQELKIDKSLILQLDKDKDDQKIVRSTIEMAHHLGLEVIAEGVENAKSIQMLHTMGCDVLQGYYIAKPMSLQDLEQWLVDTPEKVQQIPNLLKSPMCHA